MKTWQLYRVTSPSGKVYFGITSRQLRVRWKQHRNDARDGSALPLHAAVRKYGDAAFVVETLVIGDQAYINELEIRAIAHFRSNEREYGYNVAGGGGGVLGVKPSPENVAKLVARCIGKKRSPETIERIKASKAENPYRWPPERRAAHVELKTGSRHTEETKAKMRASMKGVKRSPEAGANISAGKTGKKLPPRGPMSEAAKAHLRAVKTGTRQSDEAKAKLSAYFKGRKLGPRGPLSDEHRANLSAALKGKKHSKRKGPLSAEHRARIGAALRARRLAAAASILSTG